MTYKYENECPDCGCGLARSIQKRGDRLRPYPPDFLTCCNPACRIVINMKTGEKYKKGKLVCSNH